MKESYSEGLAIHADPESCGGARKGAAEALTGADAGQPLSRERNKQPGVPTLSKEAEGHTVPVAIARLGRTPRGRRPCARIEPIRTGTGRSHV